MRLGYTQEQLDYLRVGYKTMRVPELTAAFNNEFDQARTEKAIKSTLKREGFKCGRKPGFKKGERLTYTKEQMAFIKDAYTRMSLVELTEAFNQKFGADKKASQLRSLTRNQRIRSGRSGRFEKGVTPWNTGTKGVMKPNSGSFKKGNVPGNIKPMYHERICPKDGFILIKVPERNPYTGAPTRYKHKHVWIWEQVNGPVPADHVIRFLDGNKMNCVQENLGLFTRAESLQMSRLGFSEAPDEVKPTITAMAKLDTKLFETTRKYSGGNTGAEVEKKVLEIANRLPSESKGFSTLDIQREGWPEESGHQAVRLGISQAIQNLKRKGKIILVTRGIYAVDG